MAKKTRETVSVDCSECYKPFDAPNPDRSKDDSIEMDCPHCGQTLMLDRVSYWVASGTGDT